MSAGTPCQDIEGLEVNQRKNVPHGAVICRRSAHARLSSAGVAVIISFTESHHQPSSTEAGTGCSWHQRAASDGASHRADPALHF